MAAHVSREVVAEQEGASASLARVGAQARVGSYVAREFYGGGEARLAVVAFVGFVGCVAGLVAFQALQSTIHRISGYSSTSYSENHVT